MKTLLPTLAFLAALIFSSCDSPEPNPPKQGAHKATATVQLYPSPLFPTTDRFIANEAALLTSGPIIQASQISASSLIIEPIPGTDLLNITAHHDDQAQAKIIVQSLLETYLSHRKRVYLDSATENLKALDEQLIHQTNLFQKNREDLTALLHQYGIPIFQGNILNQEGLTEENMFRSARQKLAQFETQRDQIGLEIGEIHQIEEDKLVEYAAGLDIPGNQALHYFTQHREAFEVRRTLIAQGLGEAHPDVIAIEKRAETALKFAKKEAASLAQLLVTQQQILERQIEQMKQRIKEEENDTDGVKQKIAKYKLLKKAEKQSGSILQNLQLDQQRNRTTLSTAPQILTIHGWSHE